MKNIMSGKVRAGIVGASGYSGEELVRLLLAHPHVELAAVTSRQYAGQTLAQVFPKFSHHPRAKSIRFTEPNAALLATQEFMEDKIYYRKNEDDLFS